MTRETFPGASEVQLTSKLQHCELEELKIQSKEREGEKNPTGARSFVFCSQANSDERCTAYERD